MEIHHFGPIDYAYISSDFSNERNPIYYTSQLTIIDSIVIVIVKNHDASIEGGQLERHTKRYRVLYSDYYERSQDIGYSRRWMGEAFLTPLGSGVPTTVRIS